MKESSQVQTSFTPSSGQAWTNWDYSSPIFNQFVIVGPPTMMKESKPTILYTYPENETLSDLHTEKFLFVNGQNYQTMCFKQFGEVVDHFGKYSDIIDKVVLMRNCLGEPLFTFAVTFQCSSFTRPAILDPNLVNEFLSARAKGKTLSCKFAFAFISRHPFSDLYFTMLHALINLEPAIRSNGRDISFILTGKQSNDIDPITLWPCDVFYARNSLLELFYNTSLPIFGEQIGLFSRSIQPFIWKMPFPYQVPLELAKMGFVPFMSWITPQDFAHILSYMLLENSFIVIGSDIWSVVKTVIFLGQILSPLEWPYPVITILPPELSDFLSSPLPYIYGVSSNQPHQIENHIIQIDLDNQRILWPGMQAELQKGKRVKRTISQRHKINPFKKKKDSLNSFASDEEDLPKDIQLRPMPFEQQLLDLIIPLMTPNRFTLTQSTLKIEEFMRIISSFLKETYVDKIDQLTVLNYNSDRGYVPSFDKERFKSLYPEADRQFISEYLDTQMFFETQSKIADMKLSDILDKKKDSSHDMMSMGSFVTNYQKSSFGFV